MADKIDTRHFRNHIYTRLSRLTWVNDNRYTSHAYNPKAGYNVPTDLMEIFYTRLREGYRDLEEYIENSDKVSRSDSYAGKLVIGMRPLHAPKEQSSFGQENSIMEIDKMAKIKNMSVLLVEDFGNGQLAKKFPKQGVYKTKGYYDWGIDYGPYRSVGMIRDIAGLWNFDHEFGTIVIPAYPTVGGLLRARQVMRKANVMISVLPKTEDLPDGCTEYQQKLARLIDEMYDDWEPATFIYAGSPKGSIAANGDMRKLALSRHMSRPVVKLYRGTEEFGPIKRPDGFGPPKKRK